MTDKLLQNIFVRFIRYIIDWRDTRKVIQELNRLSDRDLRDIGICRGDIDNLVYTKKHKLERGKKT